MASVIRIKRSRLSLAPAAGSLQEGELAYSAGGGIQSDGGGRLYIGAGAGNPADLVVIGGKYFTDLLDHEHGKLTASSALIVDSNKKLDELLVENLSLKGNTLSVSNSNGNLVLQPNGTGKVSINNAYTLPSADSTSSYVLTTNGSGAVSFQQNNLSVGADSGTTASISILNGSLVVAGGTGIDTSVSGSTITVAGKDATTSTKGVASFSSDNFSVTSGAVSVKDAGIANIKLVNSKTTLGTTDLTLGATTASIFGLTTAQVGAIQLSGSTITGQSTSTNLNISLAGNTKLSINGAYTLPRVDGSAGYVLTTDGSGAVTFQASSSSLTIKDGLNNTSTVDLLTEQFSILGGTGIDTLVTDNTVTISGANASTSVKGVAKFTSTDFTVNSGEVALVANRVKDIVFDGLDAGEGIDITFNTSTHVTTIAAELASDTNAGVASFSSNDFAVSVAGAVTIKTGGVGNAQLENSKVTVGSTDISLGSTSTTLAGLTQIDVNYLRLTGNTIAGTTATYEVVIDPSNGIGNTGTVNVSNARITNLATPIADSDAATKSYVDSVAQGLDAKQSVKCATYVALNSYLYDNGTDGVGATITATANGALSMDGVTPTVGSRVLVKDETGANAPNNGIYVVTTVGGAGTKFKLTRTTDFDNGNEVPGAFTFIEQGTVNGDTGWVCATNASVTVGSTDISWIQFSAAGTYSGGVGLSLDGLIFNINTSTGTGLYVSGDTLQIDPTLAGNGLTYNTGVLAVGGTTDRITVAADAIDIAATYVGQTTITTVGTIAVGTWTATTIAAAYGGTGVSSYAVGDILYANSTSSLSKLSVGSSGTVLQIVGGVPVWAALDGGNY
jgi:hypothetical protein